MKPLEPTSYFQLAQHEEEVSTTGQYAKQKPFVVGTGVPPPFPAPRYAADPGLEPPLGEDVNWLPDMLTTPHGGSALVTPDDAFPNFTESEAGENEQ